MFHREETSGDNSSTYMYTNLRLIDVHQASVWINAVHQALLWLWHNMVQCCVDISLWPDDVHQASQCGSNLCIISVSLHCCRCSASRNDPNCASCIYMCIWLSTTWAKLTTPYFVHFLFSYFCLRLTLERKEKKRKENMMKSRFAQFPVCYLGTDFGLCRHSCWPGQPLEMTSRCL